MNSHFTEENLQRLRDRYKDEITRDLTPDDSTQENPIRACMRIMFEAASERNPSRRADLAFHLSEILTRPDGLNSLFLAVIDFDPSSQIRTTHNQRFMAVANIISFLPKLCLPYVQYCENLTRQLIPLVIHENEKYSSLSCLIIKALIDSPHAKDLRAEVRESLLNPYTSPLRRRSTDLKIEDAIVGIHRLILNRLPSRQFVNLFLNLFHALMALHESPSQLKGYLKTIVIRILKDLNPGPACCLIEQTLFHSDECPIYSLVAGDDQITLELAEESGLMSDFEKSKDVMMGLLEQCDEELLILEFFFHFQGKLWTSFDSDLGRKFASLLEPLLEQTVQEHLSNRLDLLSIIMSNRHHALKLLSRVLLNYLEFIRLHKDQKKHNSPSLSNCLDILEVLSSILDIHDGQILNTLIEIKSFFEPDEARNLDSLIEKMSNKPEGKSRSTGLVSPEYEEAMRDLNDHLVPVRVHALVKLKNLILIGDHYTVSRIPHLFTMIESSLAEQESYVFLASIDLMSEMALRRTNELLPRLISLYTEQGLGLQQRINVGEVLVRLSRKMNEMTPFYAPQVMGTFLAAATQSDQELVRMSSLVNIGEVCRNLGGSLGKYLVEILTCIEHILKIDTIQTKCASIELLRSALTGLDGKTIEPVQHEMSSIYKLLKKLRQNTIDDTLCLHINLALDEIDRLAKGMLGCNAAEAGDRLVKNIKVLSLLDR